MAGEGIEPGFHKSTEVSANQVLRPPLDMLLEVLERAGVDPFRNDYMPARDTLPLSHCLR